MNEDYKILKEIAKLQENVFMDSCEETFRINDNKQSTRLSEKSQIEVPQNGLNEVPSNRRTHTMEVAQTSSYICAQLACKANRLPHEIDYLQTFQNASFAHDIGHPSFGHSGSQLINKTFKAAGLKEGFEDNNNNLVICDKHELKLRDYTLMSLIKYPSALYPYQKDMYFESFKKSIEMDKVYYKSIGLPCQNLKRTMACIIMDEADRDSYTCRDIGDFLCMGHKLSFEQISSKANEFNLHGSIRSDLIDVSLTGSKSDIKKFYSDLKGEFSKNHQFSDSGLDLIDRNLYNVREYLSSLVMEYYIKPIREMSFHAENMDKLKQFMRAVMYDDFHPSSFYRKEIADATNKEDRLRAMRDLIAEVSDWYVLNVTKDPEILKQFSSEREVTLTL